MIKIINEGKNFTLSEKNILSKQMIETLDLETNNVEDVVEKKASRFTKDRNVISKKDMWDKGTLTLYNAEKIRTNVKFQTYGDEYRTPEYFYKKFSENGNVFSGYASSGCTQVMVTTIYNLLNHQEKNLFEKYFARKFKSLNYQTRVNFDGGVTVVADTEDFLDSFFVSNKTKELFISHFSSFKNKEMFLDLMSAKISKNSEIMLSNLYNNSKENRTICWGDYKRDIVNSAYKIAQKYGKRYKDDTSQYSKFLIDSYFALPSNFDLRREFRTTKRFRKTMYQYIKNHDFTDFLSNEEATQLTLALSKLGSSFENIPPFNVKEVDALILATMFDIPFYEFIK